MRLTIQVDGGPRVTFEDVPDPVILAAFQTLLGGPLSVSVPIKEKTKTETPARVRRQGSYVAPCHAQSATRKALKNASPSKPGGTLREDANAVTRRVLEDGEFHAKAEVVDAWLSAGLVVSTGLQAAARINGLERTRRGRRAWWRLPSANAENNGVPVANGRSVYLGALSSSPATNGTGP